MTICADDFAELDLLEDPLPTESVEAKPDVEVLLADVVELQDDGICFSAVGTRVDGEVLEEELGPDAATFSLPSNCLIDVTLPVSEVMLSSVLGPTRAAVRVGRSADPRIVKSAAALTWRQRLQRNPDL
jgi:hypothetical protein